MDISEHISYNEATQSPTAIRFGIENTPTEHQLFAMRIVASVCFEPLRNWYGKPIKINSFFRCTLLNQKVGGSSTSSHTKGEAMDISAGSKEENKKLFDWCKANLIWDQLIWEYGDNSGPDWVHISFRQGQNRNQTIRIS
jgi:zinc D-Ala-D-Ala carboxypeptidase